MTDFSREFFHTLRWRPLQALEALYWHVTRRRVRARNRLWHNWHMAPDAYRRWTRAVERNPEVASKLVAESAAWPTCPLISVMVDAAGSDVAALAAQLASVLAQPYTKFEVLVCGKCAALPDDSRLRRIPVAPDTTAVEAALAAAEGSLLVPLAPGALLPETALLRWAEALRANPRASALYADEDLIDGAGARSRPWLKPEWHRELLLSQDYLSGCCAIPVEAARARLPLTGERQAEPLYGLLLELTADAAPPACHVPHILCHRPDWRTEHQQGERLAVLGAHLHGTGAEVTAGPFGSHRVRWPLPAELPLVSIIVPTRDKADLLRACLGSIIEKTIWPAYEIIVVDNNSEEPETFDCFDEFARHPAVRVLADPRPYNFSAINNRAVGEARGEYMCLLNNDTEVIAPDWLDELMRQALRPQAGAVGAKLLYPDGSIQHAGVVIGMGNAAGHAHRTLPDGQIGYFAQAHVAREATAVTAACLVVEKAKFDAVGGFDEQDFAIAYNDVDLCLKLREAGWTNFYVPTAVLYHHESVSRGDDFAPEHNARYLAELAALRERWGTAVFIDPLHHPLLDRATDQYTLNSHWTP